MDEHTFNQMRETVRFQMESENEGFIDMSRFGAPSECGQIIIRQVRRALVGQMAELELTPQAVDTHYKALVSGCNFDAGEQEPPTEVLEWWFWQEHVLLHN